MRDLASEITPAVLDTYREAGPGEPNPVILTLKLAAVLEPVINERVAEELERIAADPAYRLSGHSGISVSRVRAQQIRETPDE